MTLNYLSPNKIKVIIGKFPDIQITAQKTNIPGITLNPVKTPVNSSHDAWFPGDKIEYEDLIVTFIVDTKLAGYKAVRSWMNEITGQDGKRPEYFSDITVEILNNHFGINQTIQYKYCMPYQITGAVMDTSISEETPITFDCVFKFSDMNIIDNT